MALDLVLTGGPELRYVAHLLRKAALGDLEKKRRQAQRDAVKPLQREIKAEAAESLPKAGGYAATMARTVRVSVRFGGSGAPVLQARVYATGKGELRDVRRVNAGTLRHPVFGRFRMTAKGWKPNQWKVTRVRPGFVTRPAERTWDAVFKASDEAHRQYLEMIARA